VAVAVAGVGGSVSRVKKNTDEMDKLSKRGVYLLILVPVP